MIDNAVLMAYVDGELAPEARLEVDRAVASSPDVASQLQHHRALRNLMAGAFEGALHEPLPSTLTALITQAPASGEVVNLQTARHEREQRIWRHLPLGAGLAASLVVGLFIGAELYHLRRTPSVVSGSNGVYAEGQLSRVLDLQLAANQPDAADIKVGVSLRTADGKFCRTFTMGSEAGLACREPNAWRIKVMETSSPADKSAYKTASSAVPSAVLEAAQSLMVGPALDAKSEAAAKASHWR